MNYISTHSTYYAYTNSNTPTLWDARPYFSFYYSQNEQGQTIYTMKVYIQWTCGSGEGFWGGDYNINCIIAGETFNRTGYWSTPYYSNDPQLLYLFDVTKTVNCNDDGTGVPITYSINGGIHDYYPYRYGATYSFTPPTCVIKSTITNDTSETSRELFGNPVTFTIDRNSENFTHDLSYTIGDATYTIGTNVATSATYTFPTSIISKFTVANPYITVDCTTKNGSTIMGTTQTTVYLLLPDTYVPTASLAVEDAMSNKPTALAGLWIKNKSMLKGTITAAGCEGSTIASISSSITGNTQTYDTNPFTTQPLTISGSRTITTVVTDSRGRTATATQSISVLEYDTPSLSIAKVYRSLSDGTENSGGTYTTIELDYEIHGLNNLNTKELKYTISGTERSIPLNAYSGHIKHTVQVQLSQSTAYTIDFKLTDIFNTPTQSSYVVTVADMTLSYRKGGKGVTIGKVATEDGFNVHMNSKFYNDATFDKAYTTELYEDNKRVATKEYVDAASPFANVGTNYVEFANGFKVQWGTYQPPNANGYFSIGGFAFPIPFTQSVSITATKVTPVHDLVATRITVAVSASLTYAEVKVEDSGAQGNGAYQVNWIAVGF